MTRRTGAVGPSDDPSQDAATAWDQLSQFLPGALSVIRAHLRDVSLPSRLVAGSPPAFVPEPAMVVGVLAGGHFVSEFRLGPRRVEAGDDRPVKVWYMIDEDTLNPVAGVIHPLIMRRYLVAFADRDFSYLQGLTAVRFSAPGAMMECVGRAEPSRQAQLTLRAKLLAEMLWALR